MLLWSLLSLGCGTSQPDPATPPEPPAEQSADSDAKANADSDEPADEPEVVPGDTKIEMRDVVLEQPGGLTRVRYLSGTVKSTKKGRPPVLSNPKGYTIDLDRAEVAVDWQTLGNQMSKPKEGEKSPLAGAKFSETEDGLLRIESSKPVPFEMVGEVGTDPQGRLTIKLITLKALGVGTGLVRDALGIKLEDIVKDDKGVHVEGDTVHLDPLADSPPPKIDGKVVGASVEQDGLILRLGPHGVDVPKETSSTSVAESASGDDKNYLSFRGGTVISDNVTVRHADIRLVDQDPKDPLRLGSDTGPQIRAGYMRQPDKGKVVFYVPDNDDRDGAKTHP